jgi:proteic killer suppression protein
MQNPGSDAGFFSFVAFDSRNRRKTYGINFEIATGLLRDTYYILEPMIRSFADKATERLFRDGACPARWRNIEAVALRKLDMDMVDAAIRLDDLLSPTGNRLEALKGDRRGQHSIRINRQWRVCFRWTPDGPAAIETVDYH